ncbi:MAG: hypothetical protein KOO63_08130 [Bacteroidales bacterium]|nr:hypothetical protein [Candidatus Latescibacterota bacterium]
MPFELRHILSDEEAVDLRDDLIAAYPLAAIPPEPPTPEPPAPDPTPTPDPEMYNLPFRGVFGSNLQLPTGSRPKVYPMKDFRVRRSAMCMAIKLPVITGPTRLVISKASSRYGPGGIRHAQFTYHRDFDHPLEKRNWGDTSLSITLDTPDSRRTIFLNVKLVDNDTVPWGLQIQAIVST